MANPAPIISQINAFNATEGTIISFNIVGGTSIVRSNIIYIYDLSDNSLICTHLYISTESIHELPANTDPSIAYASGKSSADFTNGKQYYAQIQTFTNTAGTEGASGASIAKLFWCLVDPTLTINTIPSSISTTSYNVGAVYNSNTTATSNIVQQYQFNLYSATGVLVQSSGVITGSGAQQGTSTAYNLSYNFTGLNVGSSYYVTAEVTTTQGMTVSAQSSTFTVSIDTPTLGEATVVNNACDGYISVTSNLSGEYGGSASGSVATFETASVNEVSSLVVDIEPQQDLNGYDHPWVGGAGKNKLYIAPQTLTSNGITWTVNADGTVTAKGTLTSSNSAVYINATAPTGSYKFNGSGTGSSNTTYYAQIVDGSTWYDPDYGNNDKDVTISSSNVRLYANTKVSPPSGGITFKPMLRASGTSADFEPYSNLCPISGWDSVEVVVSPTTSAEDGTTHTATFDETVYGGTLDVVSGLLTVDRVKLSTTWGNFSKEAIGNFTRGTLWVGLDNIVYPQHDDKPQICNVAPLAVSFGSDTLHFYCNSSSAFVFLPNDTADSTPIEIVYELATPQTYQLTPQQIQTLVGQNNIWSEQGDVELSYHIPITNLLVKRQDVGDVSGNWLTLYSQPITQASDMDFTFIDFTNQYGKTYKYALVPLLTQTQSGVEVEVEGGYTVSDEVQSIFDGVFVADNTAIYKLKAGVNYGDLSKVQEVGSINTIGSQYPIIVSNSKVDYRTASLSTTIVADDYYDNGNLDRMDMVQKRELMESFFVNKRAKILKDWNGNIWLVVFIDNINISFINEYGMGIATLTATWTEIGDVTSEEDLQNTRIINVG